MYKEVVSTLTRMNLKQKDAAVYLACLHFREGLFVHEIVKQTKIKRSTVDLILQRLLEMNFVTRLRIGSRYKFFAQSPESILFQQEQITEEFKSIVPMLAKLGGSSGATEIRFFEGKKGIRQIYDDMLLRLKFAEGEGRELVSFSSGTELLRTFPDLQSHFIDKRIRMGIRFRGIVPESSLKTFEYSSNAEALREVKAINDKKFPFRVTFETYADTVMILSPQKPFGGVVIRNPQIATSMRSLFKLVWNLLPDRVT